MQDVFSSSFAQNIYLQKYSMNAQETWNQTCKRVVENVCGQYLNQSLKEEILHTMTSRKFIPGGRYLYSSGREFHQTNNCFLFRSEDSREGWADALEKATRALMTGGGIGFDYSLLREEGAIIRRTGGTSTGPIALMNMVNEAGRYIMQGGQRRSAIWAGLQWDHKDINKFLKLKDWSEDMKALKLKDFNFPLPMEGTNVSVIYNTDFFIAVKDPNHPNHKLSKEVWMNNCKQAFSTAEPGMSFNFCKDSESLRNAPVSASTKVLTNDGYIEVGDIVNKIVNVWTGKQWVNTVFKKTKENSELVKVSLSNNRFIICDPEHPFIAKNYKHEGEIKKISQQRIPAGELIKGQKIFSDLPKDYKSHKDSEIEIVSVEKLDYKEDVFCCDVGVEEHSFMAEGVLVSNCTEVVSSDDSDKCNLGTVWMNRCVDRKDFARVCHISTLFLLCGGLYSMVPSDKIREVGNKNNRIGLGLGGMHEWLMQRGMDYQVTPELHKWLNSYETESDSAAYIGSKDLSVSIPKGKRAIAPTGSIGIIAETTTGIEPLFCKSYKRRYIGKDKEWKYEYVVDGSVKRLLAQGVKQEHIKDAYDISFKDRVKFQADVQNYVDMAISSTCNMPAWGSELNNESTLDKNANLLLKYAKRLRGFTCYPDGSRGGQPLTQVSLEEAMNNEGHVFEEKENSCLNGVCGV